MHAQRLPRGHRAVLATALVFGLFSSAADAAIVFTVGERGDDVYAEWSGSVSLEGLSGSSSGTRSAGILVANSEDWIGTGAGGATDFYPGVSITSTGAWTGQLNGVGAGDILGFTNSDSVGLYITRGYASNGALFGSVTIASSTFASLGITDGVTSTVSWNAGAAGAQAVTFQTDRDAFPAPVPAPAPIALLGLGLTGLLLACRRRGSDAR